MVWFLAELRVLAGFTQWLVPLTLSPHFTSYIYNSAQMWPLASHQFILSLYQSLGFDYFACSVLCINNFDSGSSEVKIITKVIIKYFNFSPGSHIW